MTLAFVNLGSRNFSDCSTANRYKSVTKTRILPTSDRESGNGSDGAYFLDHSLRFRMKESVCLEQNSADCAPLLTRHEANSGQLFISQKDGISTFSTVPVLGLETESQFFPLYRNPVIEERAQIP